MTHRIMPLNWAQLNIHVVPSFNLFLRVKYATHVQGRLSVNKLIPKE